jgi:copper chaperone CopZ
MIKIDGMHCTACEKNITRALAKEGVTVTRIDHESGTATIEGKASKTDLGSILQSIGYTLVDEKAAKTEKRAKQQAKKDIITAERILAPGLILLVITVAIQAAAFFLYRTIPGFQQNYLVPFLVLPVIVATNAIALWYQRHEQTSCMTGMMIGMTLGMTSGFGVGAVVGLINGMFWGSIIGTIVGIAAGVYAGKCCGIMGVMEGMMAGLMGGTMGAMLTVMMVNDHPVIFLVFLTVILSAILAGMVKMIDEEGNNTGKRPWPFAAVLAASIVFTLLISFAMLVLPRGLY